MLWTELVLCYFLLTEVLLKSAAGSHVYLGFSSLWLNRGLEDAKLSPLPKKKTKFRKLRLICWWLLFGFLLCVVPCITALGWPRSIGPTPCPISTVKRLLCIAYRAHAAVICRKYASWWSMRFFMEVWAPFRATHRPSQLPASLSNVNHREVIILEQMQRLKREGMMEKNIAQSLLTWAMSTPHSC